MTFKEALDAFASYEKIQTKQQTFNSNMVALRYLGVWLRNKPLEQVTPEDVVEHINMLREFGLTQVTLYRRCIAIRKFFGFWEKRTDTASIPSDLVPVPQHEINAPRVAKHEDFEKVLGVIPSVGRYSARNLAILMLLYDTGIRVGELCSLNVKDINTEERVALVRTEKAKRFVPYRLVDWTEETNEYLKKWLKCRTTLLNKKGQADNALFLDLHHVFTKRIHRQAINEFMLRYSKQAGLPYRINPHSLRHLMGRDIVRAGGSNTDVADRLGHAHLDSTRIYTMMFGEDALRRFNDLKVRSGRSRNRKQEAYKRRKSFASQGYPITTR